MSDQVVSCDTKWSAIGSGNAPAVGYSASLPFEQRWPRWLLPVLAGATPLAVFAGHGVALQWIALALLTLPLVGALGRNQLRETGSLYLLHISAFALFVAGRGLADDYGLRVLNVWPIAADRVLGLGELPTAWLQRHLHGATPAWYDRITFATYSCHFFVIWLACFALWERSFTAFRRFCIASAIAYAAALPLHFVAPTAPPWLAARDGFIAPVTRIFLWVGRSLVPGAVDEGIAISANDVAAFPSVHMTVAWLILLACWSLGAVRRLLALAWVVLIVWSVVYGGEHYVVDTIAGALLGTLTWLLARRLTSLTTDRGGNGVSPEN